MKLLPMLAESIDVDSAAPYLDNDSWGTQRKADGIRVLIEVDPANAALQVWGRNGQQSRLPNGAMVQFAQFPARATFDGEVVGAQTLLFDLPILSDGVRLDTRFEQRHAVLEAMFDKGMFGGDVQLLPFVRGARLKTEFLAAMQSAHAEGVMFRHIAGQYRSGKRSPDLLKCKFVKEADCIVSDTWVDGKEAVELSLVNAGDQLVTVGKASMIGKSPKPQIGQVWEVRFLYCVDPQAPRLYQPRLMRIRSDKTMLECRLTQLDHCFTNKVLH